MPSSESTSLNAAGRETILPSAGIVAAKAMSTWFFGRLCLLLARLSCIRIGYQLQPIWHVVNLNCFVTRRSLPMKLLSRRALKYSTVWKRCSMLSADWSLLFITRSRLFSPRQCYYFRSKIGTVQWTHYESLFIKMSFCNPSRSTAIPVTVPYNEDEGDARSSI